MKTLNKKHRWLHWLHRTCNQSVLFVRARVRDLASRSRSCKSCEEFAQFLLSADIQIEKELSGQNKVGAYENISLIINACLQNTCRRYFCSRYGLKKTTGHRKCVYACRPPLTKFIRFNTYYNISCNRNFNRNYRVINFKLRQADWMRRCGNWYGSSGWFFPHPKSSINWFGERTKSPELSQWCR